MTVRFIAFITTISATFACSTSYKINSFPEGATVFHKSGGETAVLGTTPFEFQKSGLPDEAPFILAFERSGFERQDVAITPTDSSLTVVNVTLKPSGGNPNDPGLLRARKVVSAVFKIQEQVYAKRYVDALAAIKQLEQVEPDFAEILALKGSIYFVIGDKTQARESWEKALKLDPGLDMVRTKLGQLSLPAGAGGVP